MEIQGPCPRTKARLSGLLVELLRDVVPQDVVTPGALNMVLVEEGTLDELHIAAVDGKRVGLSFEWLLSFDLMFHLSLSSLSRVVVEAEIIPSCLLLSLNFRLVWRWKRFTML